MLICQKEDAADGKPAEEEGKHVETQVKLSAITVSRQFVQHVRFTLKTNHVCVCVCVCST